MFRSDREALKKFLIEEARAKLERPTPVAIEKRTMGIEREEAALRAVESVRAAGGTAHYRSVNLLDGPAVAAILDEIRFRNGRIDVLLHAGGIEISRKIEEKEPVEFDLVFDIKADGFFSILKGARGSRSGRPSSSLRLPAASGTRAKPTTARRTTCSASGPPT